MAKTITRSDVREIARAHGWAATTSSMSGDVAPIPLRDLFTKDRWTLSVGWNITPFTSEPRFGYAILEGGERPAGVPNISGNYRSRRGIGACVVSVLKDDWRP